MLTTHALATWSCCDTESEARAPAGPWLPCAVPGDVHGALLAAGRIRDWRIGDGAKTLEWTDSRAWWLRTAIDGATLPPGALLDLVIDGPDGHVEVLLDGAPLAVTRNAFRRYRIGLPAAVRQGRHELLLRFAAVTGIVGPRRDAQWGWYHRTRMRKPQYPFGWDWSLPIPSIGVLGGAWIEAHDGARIIDVAFATDPGGRVDVDARVTMAARDAGYDLELRIDGHGAAIRERFGRAGRVKSYTTVRIPDPRPWWPRGQGDPALYDYELLLWSGGRIVDQRRGRIGLRTVAVREDPFRPESGPGRSFWFEVNGRRVFAKGSNVIPAEVFPAMATDAATDRILDDVVAAHFNMVRIWGGGIYERDRFYDRCDELGILVWQDFMCASGHVPVEELRDELAAEAEWQIRRLRNHPCLAIWCGSNEDVDSWRLQPHAEDVRPVATVAGGGQADMPEDDHAARRRRDDPQLFTMMFRGLVSRHGKGVPFIESSPWSHDDWGNLPESGNGHLSCWKFGLTRHVLSGRSSAKVTSPGLPPIPTTPISDGPDPGDFRAHFEAVQSFDSEFCIQGPSCVRSLVQMLPEGHRWPITDLWTWRFQSGHFGLPHAEAQLAMMTYIFGAPQSLAEFSRNGQAMHAEQFRCEIESARRDRPDNGGTMVWMQNDCWPTSNWSIVEHDGTRKPAWYAARRSCAPHTAIIMARGGLVEVFASNDAPQPVRFRLRLGLRDVDGGWRWQRQYETTVGGMATLRLDRLDPGLCGGRAGEHLQIDGWADAAALPPVTWFRDGWKDVPWPRDPGLSWTITARESGRTTVAVTAARYARMAHLVPGDPATWQTDDNFADIPAGATWTTTVRHADPAWQPQVGHWWTAWP